MRCKECGSNRMIKSGHITRMNKGKHEVVYQVYKCKNCGTNRCIRIRG